MQPKCLSDVDLAQNSNDMSISCMQGTHYSYLSQHYVRSDALQAEPSKIFPMKGLGLFVFLPFTVQYKANFKIIIKNIYTQSRVCIHM